MDSNPWAFGIDHLVTLTVAVVAMSGVLVTTAVRQRADRRVELWNRLQWGLDRCAIDDDKSRALGLVSLSLALESANDKRMPRLPARLSGYDEMLLCRILIYMTTVSERNPK